MAKRLNPFRDHYLMMAEEWDRVLREGEQALSGAKAHERQANERTLEDWRARAAGYRKLAE